MSEACGFTRTVWWLLQVLHRESKKDATLTMAITLSILDGFAKKFHCRNEH